MAGMPVPKSMPEHLRKKLGIQEEVVESRPVMEALMKYGKICFSFIVDNAVTLVAVPSLAVAALKLHAMHSEGELLALWGQYSTMDVSFNLMAFLAACMAMAILYLRSLFVSRPVYLVDFEVHRPPESWVFTREWAMERAQKVATFTPDQVEFQMKVLLHSGLGNATYLPEWLSEDPPNTTMEMARVEFDQICITAVKDLLAKTHVRPRDIGIVIVNCSLFSPTPSLTACIMNHFNMASTTIGYNLSGMGCSAGVIAVDLARELLQNHPNTYALVVSTENITQNLYMGKQKSMLIPNVIFRVGGAAMLLSNKARDSWRSKYRLQHLVRTMNSSDRGYTCVMELEDDEGIRGVKLSRELMKIAGETLKMNLTRLGPKVLPLSELLIAGVNLLAVKLLGSKKVKPYVPDFTKVFKHVCIHTGGRAVIDAIEDQMGFSKKMVEPSRASLFRFGNVSSASIWYVLAYIESFNGLKSGEKVWQMGFGSGFKANSAVWVANRPIKEMHNAWEGFSIEDMYEELKRMEVELWKLVETSIARHEKELEERKARGEDVSHLQRGSTLKNTVEAKRQ